MNIIWQYLDKRSGAVDALKDYNSMKFIIENTADEVKNVKEDMSSLRGTAIDGLPHTHNPQSGEDTLIRSIDEIDVLKERYRQALEFLHWFEPAWFQLSDDERYILEIFYQENNAYCVYDICSKYSIEKSSAYNKKNRALSHLATLLFGK